jgi:putative ABC transport system substrate-binding protein
VIATFTPLAAVAAKNATASIPIVFNIGSDPIKDGLVGSLNHPGGNITGATFFANLLVAKRTQLLHELVPNAKLFGTLVNPGNPNAEFEINEAQNAAAALGVRLVLAQGGSENQIDDAIANLAQQHADALLVAGDASLQAHDEQIAKLAIKHALPTCFTLRADAAAGALMSYGASNTDSAHQVGNYVGRILGGEKPGDLPVQQPTRFEFVINMITAKALGLSVPTSMQLLADEVIE